MPPFTGTRDRVGPSSVEFGDLAFDFDAAAIDAVEGTYHPLMASASQAEMEAGTEAALRAMSPLRVAQAIAALAGGGGGLTQEQAEDIVALLIDDNSDLDWTYDDVLASLVAVIKAGSVTNAMLAGSIDQAKVTNLVSDLAAKLASSSYTAADVLAKLLTVDGSGSGVDADLLDGQQATAFATAAQGTAADAAKAKTDHLTVTQAVDLDAIETRVNALDAAVVLKGTWDASAGTFPGSGTAQAGESWIVSVGGTVGGQVFVANDRIVAIADNASTGTYAANWHKLDYTDAVLSVAGLTGAISAAGLKTALAIALADITDASANGRSLVAAANYAAMRALLNVEDGATADQTAAEILAALLTVDGSGSGLDADKLRGTTPSAFGLTVIDDADAATARTTLGLGTAATVNTGTASGDLPLLSTGGVLPIARLATGTPDGTKFVRDDGTLAVPAGGGGSGAGGWGIPRTFLPGLRASPLAVSAVNEAHYYRVEDSGAITAVYLRIGVASGNISIAAYTNSGSGRAATPTGGRLATTGAISCPASGEASVALACTVPDGGWFGISADNTTATIQSAISTGGLNPSALANGMQMRQASAHPLPATPASLTGQLGGPAHILVGG